ncbi:hypothetical protein ON010_g11178 [Phytophthora cinnamomi]|nr:hypothetical protein ON010_g11178 [Phytophthora cinnamomi]
MERRAIVDRLLKTSVDGVLPLGALSACTAAVGRHCSTIVAIWECYASLCGVEWQDRHLLTEEYIAQRAGKNRLKGAVSIPNITSSDPEVIKRYMLE